MAWDNKDLNLLCKYAERRMFIMETGGGVSTLRLAKVAKKYKSKIVSIEVDSHNTVSVDGVDYQIGWSITYEDMVKKGDKNFVDRDGSYPHLDRNVAVLGEKYMNGERDLIRKSIAKYECQPDFFFCDTGEYCGLAEWNVVKNVIPIGGIFACHDIYYPKSIKCFKVVKKIKRSKNWKIIKKTSSKQGILIAERIK